MVVKLAMIKWYLALRVEAWGVFCVVLIVAIVSIEVAGLIDSIVFVAWFDALSVICNL